MQEHKKTFETLEQELLERLKERGCSSVTITGYRYLCNSIISWLQDNGYDYYTEEGGIAFLQDYLKTHGNNQYYKNLRTAIYRLNDLTIGSWKNVHSDKGKKFFLSAEFKDIVDKYCFHEENKGLTAGTIKHKRYAISWFLHELEKRKCCSLLQITPEAVIMSCTRITYHSLWGEIKLFLRYLVAEGKIDIDYSTLVPHYSRPYVIPSIYSINEIKRIENSIDTDTVLGKRDYAIVLLASRMGLRSGDIVRLKIDDVKGKDEIKIIQQKTGNKLHLPLIKDVSDAINNYLMVRPQSTAEEIFINVYAPYNPITTSTIRNALRKYILLANIDTGNRRKGPHALRSSLASSMVNDNASYEIVRKVLGHSSNNAIKHYARIDIEKLRVYSLEPPAVSGGFKAFLNGEVL